MIMKPNPTSTPPVTTSSRRMRRSLVGLAIAVLFALVALPSLVADPVTAPREIVLTARHMAFYLDGNPTPNPTLRVKAGEPVTITLRSEDIGITHDVAVRSWNIGTALLSGKGAVSVSFRVPDRRDGPTEYVCSAHAVMMRGSVEID
jgi:plastocyanin